MSTLRTQRLNAANLLANHFPPEIYPEESRNLLDRVIPLDPLYREDLCFAASAIGKDDVESFRYNGWKTVYQRGITWHLDYGSTPAHALFARRFNDERLFGGECRESLTFAMLNCPGVGGDPLANWRHLKRHGDYVIVWKLDAWRDHATVAWGDSQQNAVVHPYSVDTCNKLHALYTSAGLGIEHLQDHPVYSGPRNPYLELQIHRQLTIDDVEGWLDMAPDGQVVRANPFAETA